MNRTEVYAPVEELREVAPRPRSGRWLAGRFEVSIRTIERDVAALQQPARPSGPIPAAAATCSTAHTACRRSTSRRPRRPRWPSGCGRDADRGRRGWRPAAGPSNRMRRPARAGRGAVGTGPTGGVGPRLRRPQRRGHGPVGRAAAISRDALDVLGRELATLEMPGTCRRTPTGPASGTPTPSSAHRSRPTGSCGEGERIAEVWTVSGSRLLDPATSDLIGTGRFS